MKTVYHQLHRYLFLRVPRLAVRCIVMAMGLLLISNMGYAQQQDFEVSGTVVDAFGENPMPGVNIMVIGTQIGTSADLDGNYTLVAPSGQDTLRFTFVGYEPIEVPIEGQSTINVEMESTQILGTEVVVTGYSEQQRRDLTGSVSVADMQSVERIAESTVSRQLQGQVSGVTVTGTGQPGSSPSIRIRGVGNFGNVEPLYVVDGMPTQDIDHLNPGDIETIQVLKDASAASIYGARASNGVIEITTKQGDPGIEVTFNSRVGWEIPHLDNPWDIASPQDHADLMWMAHEHTTGETPESDLYGDGNEPVLPDYIRPAGAMEGEVDEDSYFLNPFYTDPGAMADFTQITRANKEGTDYYDEVFDVAPQFQNELAVSGGTQDASYRVSLSYLNQDGTLLRTGMERYTGRVNTQFDITDNFRVGQNASFTQYENPSAFLLSEGSIGMVFRQQPIIPVRDIGGNWAGNAGANLGNATNPVAMRERTRHNEDLTTNVFGNVYAELDLLDNFTLRSNFGGEYGSSTYNSFSFPTYEEAENDPTNSYSSSSDENLDWTWSNTLAYNNVLADVHNVSVTLGSEAVRESGAGRGGSRQGYFSFNPDYTNLSTGAGDPTAYSYEYANTLFSLFGRINYDYDSRYLASFTLRRDGSSRFAEEERYGTFPAGSIGWRISDEQFMADADWLNNLQIRAGYGIMGNQLNVDPDNAFTLFGGNELGTFYPITGTSLEEGFAQTRIGNPQARWEEAHNANIGFNLAILGNMFELDADYYQNDVQDLLFNPDLPGQAGVADQPFINVANVENSGIDASLTGRFLITSDLSINTNLNFTTYNNEIVQIAEGTEYFDQDSRRFESGIVRNMVGHPISSFFGYEIEGFWDTQQEMDEANAEAPGGTYQEEMALGRFRYADKTGDGQVTPDDRTILGDPHPDFTYGFNLDASFRNLDAAVFLYGSQGNDVWNQAKWWTDFYPSFQGAKSNTAVHDSWTEENKDATAPIQENSASFSTNRVPNSYYVEDGSYLRLQSVQVGYTLAPDLLQALGISTMRIYVQSQNLFTITGYSGPDPEIGDTEGSNASTTAFGIDEGSYPSHRQFLMGINLQL